MLLQESSKTLQRRPTRQRSTKAFVPATLYSAEDKENHPPQSVPPRRPILAKTAPLVTATHFFAPARHAPDPLSPHMGPIFSHVFATSFRNKPISKPLALQPEINKRMRCILFDWLFHLAHRYSLSRRTIFLTANVFDRFVVNNLVSRKQLQLIGLACLLIASKFEDIHPPDSSELCSLSNDSYSKEDLLGAEGEILFKLNFELIFVSALDVIELLLKNNGEEGGRVEKISLALLEILLFYQFIDRFGSFSVGAFAVYYGYVLIGRQPPPMLEGSFATQGDFDKMRLIVKKVIAYQKVDDLKFLAQKYVGIIPLIEAHFN